VKSSCEYRHNALAAAGGKWRRAGVAGGGRGVAAAAAALWRAIAGRRGRRSVAWQSAASDNVMAADISIRMLKRVGGSDRRAALANGKRRWAAPWLLVRRAGALTRKHWRRQANV